MSARAITTAIRLATARLLNRGRIAGGKRLRIDPHVTIQSDRGTTIELGEGCYLGRGSMLCTYGGSIRLGKNVSINPYTIVYGHGGVTIGNDVRIAAHTVIIPANHKFHDVTVPIRRQGMSMKGIVIEDDVWIGANVVVLDGTHIGHGCVIGAGSVVRGKLEPMGIYVGNPALRRKERAQTNAPASPQAER